MNIGLQKTQFLTRQKDSHVAFNCSFNEIDSVIHEIEKKNSKFTVVNKKVVKKTVTEEIQTDPFPISNPIALSHNLETPQEEYVAVESPALDLMKQGQKVENSKIKFLCTMQYNSLGERLNILNQLGEISNSLNLDRSNTSSSEQRPRRTFTSGDVESSQISQLEEISKFRQEIMSKFSR